MREGPLKSTSTPESCLGSVTKSATTHLDREFDTFSIIYNLFFFLCGTELQYTLSRGPRHRIREVACDYFFKGRGDSVPVSFTIYISLCAEQFGSRMVIPDPNFSIQDIKKIPDSGTPIRIHIKEFNYF
jgi:hypothetical protein